MQFFSVVRASAVKGIVDDILCRNVKSFGTVVGLCARKTPREYTV